MARPKPGFPIVVALALAFTIASLNLLYAQGETPPAPRPDPAASGAQMTDGPMADGHMAGMAQGDGAHGTMADGMGMTPTGDPDVDFARGMIVHHQGAIDMARTVLDSGSDPEIRELAEAIVAAQQAEIAFLTDWLDRHGG
ncbi:DUF305 domain-containing protein [Maribius pontilimi]|uniref:DUF305 domain-containing protein n=1 Tax=Palleronia pontilimi TaxID=1964209 RepID=A0A934IH08_9RHOB|nr:DUF305 domain-containing protein [Palleronia pontilimi]MBJ3762686.1 DUF305 domain-containing protein [Palleronia pontilimi]